MNVKDLLNNKIIICFDEEKHIFFNLKKEDPFLNFKIMSIQEVYERLTFVYDYQALSKIIETKKVSLKAARDIVICLRFVDETNDFDNLLTLKNILFNEGKLVKKEYQKYILQKTEVLLFNQTNNIELCNLLTKNNVKFRHISLNDLKFETKKEYKLLRFRNRFSQFNEICNQICNLLKQGIKVDDIAIRTNYKDLELYFATFEQIYNLKFYYKKDESLRNVAIIQELLKRFYEYKTFELEVEDNEFINQIYELIDKFNLRQYEFEFSYNLLIELIDTYKDSIISKVGILVTDKFLSCSKKYIFELDFDFANYPRVASDDGYYNDQQLLKLSMNPSYVVTQIDNDKKKLFLETTNVILTVTNSSFSSEVFMSTYIEELKIQVEDYTKISLKNNSSTASKLEYSSLFQNYKFSKSAADIKHFYDKFVDIDGIFNFEFKHFKDENNSLKVSSYSQLKKYFECPFKYFCEHTLGLRKNVKNKSLDVGNFMHKVLENIYDNIDNDNTELDFENRFHNALNNEKFNFDQETKIFYSNVIKHYLKYINDYLIKRYKQGVMIGNRCEYNISYNINGVQFTGKIDSILCSAKRNVDGDIEEKYLTVIDYKTDSETFDPVQVDYGLCLQLPLYSVFLSNDKQFEEFKIGGLFVQPLLDSESIKDKNCLTEATFYNSLKLAGIYEEKSEYLSSFEHTLDGNVTTSSYFKGNKSKAEINVVKEVALNKLKEFIEGVNNFNFEILPYKFDENKDENEGCKYCDYKNICFTNGFKYRKVNKTRRDKKDEI